MKHFNKSIEWPSDQYINTTLSIIIIYNNYIRKIYLMNLVQLDLLQNKFNLENFNIQITPSLFSFDWFLCKIPDTQKKESWKIHLTF